MSTETVDLPSASRAPARVARLADGGTIVLFAGALFASAFLLFSVQPMFAKMVLPRLGGAPGVWNTCVVFFQGALLLGYLYAHALGSYVTPGRQVLLHSLLLLAGFAAIPLVLPQATASVAESPVRSLIWWLVSCAGLPFFVVATSAPLLQRWFSRTGHAQARDPYFLYAASNAGSLAALLAYPFAIEPWLDLGVQGRWWASGYAILSLLVLACGLVMAGTRALRQTLVPADDPLDRAAAPGSKDRLIWTVLAFVPSSLMLAVTTYFTTDVAAVPLLWVAPLALYLLTFIVAFSRRTAASPMIGRFTVGLLLLLIPAAGMGFWQPLWLFGPLHGVAFTAASYMCHAELARRRPSARHLTEFYIWIALGGVLGGAFNTFLAPAVFHKVAEYPLAMALACAAVPGAARASSRRLLDLLLPGGVVVLAVVLALTYRFGGLRPLDVLVLFTALSALTIFFVSRPVRVGLSALGLAVVALTVDSTLGSILHAERTFFGVYRVRADPTGSMRLFAHGTTLHGRQSLEPGRGSEPLTYFHRSGPIGDVLSLLQSRQPALHVAVTGLGAGSLAAYARPADRWTFFEIDPAVRNIASTGSFFTFLADCGSACDVVVGDARLTLAERPNGEYDVLILDAFSSDSIPVHLLTVEAVGLYASKITDDGVLAFNVSNRHLDLEAVVAGIAQARHLNAMARFDQVSFEEERRSGKSSSQWIVLARAGHQLLTGLRERAWRPARVRPGARLWTDSYSNILSVLRRS